MAEYNYNKQINTDVIYTNIIANVGLTPSLFDYNILTFDIKIKFDEILTLQQEADLDATINDYIYEELVRTFSLIPVVGVDNISSKLSYVGYGYESSCKIQKVSSSGNNYVVTWASGNENFDKVWSNRYNYTYF